MAGDEAAVARQHAVQSRIRIRRLAEIVVLLDIGGVAEHPRVVSRTNPRAAGPSRRVAAGRKTQTGTGGVEAGCETGVVRRTAAAQGAGR